MKQDWSYKYNVNFARYKQKVQAYKEGRPIPEISDVEAKKLYDEQLKAGNVKSELPLDPSPVAAEDEPGSSDDSESSEDESPEPAKEPSPPKSPPRASKRRKGAAPEKKSSPVKPTPAKQTEPASSPEAERAVKSPEAEKKKKVTKKSAKATEEVEPKGTPAAATSSPPKSIGQDKARRSRKKRKSEAVED